MTGIVNWLDRTAQTDRRVVAILRRSLGYAPGTFVPSFAYVEPFLQPETSAWRRQTNYLVAGLWASHWREGRAGAPETFATACGLLDNEKRIASRNDVLDRISSTEARFIQVLDADAEQLVYRLRQMVALVIEYPVNFDALLKDLFGWRDGRKIVQNRWAKDFYRTRVQRSVVRDFAKGDSK